ncbi:MAG: biotin--[acetyl-CoA-carboxylase] ligase [Fuerstiella sp.]
MSIFDLSRIQEAAELQHLEFHPVLNSTNSLAMQLIADLAACRPALILTEQQTAGRGRGSHQWFSDAGALTFSLVLGVEAIPAAERSMISIATGVAVRKTLEDALNAALQTEDTIGRGRDIMVKWPNDVMIDGRKVCGVLTELSADTNQVSVVIGVGINVNNSLISLPAEIQSKATSIFDVCGQSVDLSELLIQLLLAIQDSCNRLMDDQMGLIQELNQQHLLTNKLVTIDLGHEIFTGQCVGVDETGCLLLQSPDGVRQIVAGSIVSWE